MTAEIVKQLMAIKNTGAVNEQSLVWLKWVEAQRSQTTMLKCLKESKEFNTISK